MIKKEKEKFNIAKKYYDGVSNEIKKCSDVIPLFLFWIIITIVGLAIYYYYSSTIGIYISFIPLIIFIEASYFYMIKEKLNTKHRLEEGSTILLKIASIASGLHLLGVFFVIPYYIILVLYKNWRNILDFIIDLIYPNGIIFVACAIIVIGWFMFNHHIAKKMEKKYIDEQKKKKRKKKK